VTHGEIMKSNQIRSVVGLVISKTALLLIGIVVLTIGGPLANGAARADVTVATNVIEIKAPMAGAAHPIVSDHRCHILPVKRASGQLASPPILPDCDRRPARVPANASAPAIPATCFNGCGVMNYNGGPVVTQTTHTFYFLNCSINCFTDQGDPYGFLKDFFNSNFVHVTDQYMEPSVLKTSGRYTTSSQGFQWTQAVAHTIHDSDVQAFIVSLIKVQFPSGGGGGYQAMYTLFLPAGQDLCFNSSTQCYCPDNNCGGGTFVFCAYHGSFDSTDAVGNPIHVIYQAMPYQNVSGCQTTGGPNGTLIDSSNSVLSHEITETITDPDPNTGWTRNSDGNEIGDICFNIRQNPMYLNANAYDIQPEYSNAAQNCVGAFETLAVSHDFNLDMNSDVLLRDSNSGTVANWLMNGNQILSATAVGGLTSNWLIFGTGDFNGDGNSDILLRDSNSGTVAIWEMNGSQVLAALAVGPLSSNWLIVGTGDFNGDGKSDILLRDSNSGTVAVWLMNGNQILTAAAVGGLASNWVIVGTGDVNGDGKTDILLQDSISNTVAVWEMNGSQVLAALAIGSVTSNWHLVGTGDFNGDGKSDILWRDSNSNTVAIWELNGNQLLAALAIGILPSNWQIIETGDLNGDAKSDILLRDSNSGAVGVWELNGNQLLAGVGIGGLASNWQIQSLHTD
jgi:hypothetical protein